MFTAGDVENSQAKTEVVLKLYAAGLNAEMIASCLSWEVSQVKSVVLSNDVTLAAEFAKLQEEANGLRCAHTRRLVHKPVRGLEGNAYEKKALEEWIKANGTWPNSSTPIRLPPTKVDEEMKDRVTQLSLRAIEVVESCIRRGVQKETAVDFAIECLRVLDARSNFDEFLRVLLSGDQAEQGAILRGLKEFRPSLLRKLLIGLAAKPNQYSLTILTVDFLEEAQLISKNAKAKATIIRSMKREWTRTTRGQLSALMNLVLVKLYLKLKKRAQAEEYLQEIEFAQEPADEELCEFYGDVGDLYFDLQLYERAEGNYQKAISKLKDSQSLTRVHSRLEYIQVNENYIRLASEATALGETQLAVAYQKASQVRQEESSTSCDLAKMYFTLFELHFLKKNFTRAEEYIQKVLISMQEVLPANHTDLATIYVCLGFLYASKREYSRAEEYYLKCLSIRQEVLPSSSPDLALIYNSFGILYDKQGEYSRAEEYFLKCLNIRQEVLPANHTDLATIYSNLGVMFIRKGEYTRAEEYYLKCLSIRQEVLPANHTDLAAIYNSLGVMFIRKGEYTRAEEYLLLSIRQEVLPANHLDQANSYYSLGFMYYKFISDYSRAEEYLQKSLNIRQEVLPAEHIDLKQVQYYLGRCISKRKVTDSF
jgi:tetratricopeptide (TPR) repeat protein